MAMLSIKRGDILKTPKFNEPVRVVSTPQSLYDIDFSTKEKDSRESIC